MCNILVKQKKWTLLICFKAVGIAHNNDKSRPSIHYGRSLTYLCCYSLNFLHSEATK